MKSLKRFILATSFLCLFVSGGIAVVTHSAFAQTSSVQEGADAVGQASGLSNEDPKVIVARIIRTALGFLGVIAVLICIYGGFVWMTAGGNPDKVDTAKKILLNGFIGLIIIFLSWAITTFVISALSNATGTGGGGGSGGGDSGTPLGGGSTSSFIVQGFSPEGQVSIRNVVPQITFSRTIDEASAAGKILITDAANVAVAGTFSISGNKVSFTPSALCPAPNEDRFCFPESATFTVTVATGVTSTTGTALTCSVTSSCTSSFTTGTIVDTENPFAEVTVPVDGTNVAAMSTELVQVHATDDSAVAIADFAAGDVLFDSVVAAGADLSDVTVETLWDTVSLVNGERYKVTVTVTDIAGNTDTDSVTVTARPATCFNEVLDSDLGETGVDCGGDNASATYCGACDGSSCTEDSQCASGGCSNGVCVSLPQIESVSPLSGAVGTYVTITGSGFGTTTGNVFFTTASGTGTIKAPLVVCSDGWGSRTVVVEVPDGAGAGPIVVQTSDGDEDSTDNDYGALIADFDVNDILHPGLCSLTPDGGATNAAVTLNGKNFGTPQGDSVVNFGNKTAGSYSLWSEGTLGVTVPATNDGNYDVSVTVNDVESNRLPFTVSSETVTSPVIVTIDPASGGIGQYVTLTGSNFGTRTGTVWFENPETGNRVQASVDFPDACSGDIWKDNQVTVIVPKDLELRTYNVTLTTQGNATSNIVTFTVTGDEPTPGICAIDPDSGAVGSAIMVSGDHFGRDLGTVNFSGGVIGSIGDGGWSDQSISLSVPSGAATGPVTVANRSNIQSNGVNFAITTGGSDTPTTAQAAYAWMFSTGVIPQTPEVVITCTDTQVSGVPNSRFTDEVCVNAVVYAEFTAVMDPATLDDAMVIEECTSTGNDPCADTVRVTGTATVSVSESASSVTWKPEVLFAASSTYRVTITTAATSADGVAIANNVSWLFTTKDTTEPCIIEKVIVSPNQETLTEKNTTTEFLANPVTGCVITDGTAYTWNWETDPHSYAGFASSADGACDGGATNCATLEALAEGVTAVTAEETHSALHDTGTLTINFTDPYVTNYWPDCTDACVNAEVGGEFNTKMDTDSVQDTGQIALYECANELCSSYTAVSGTTTSCTYDDDGVSCTGFALNLGGTLKVRGFYRVIVVGDVLSASGVALIHRNYGDAFSWVFRVRDDETYCAVDRVTLDPQSVRTSSVGSSATFTANAYGEADSCSTAGQRLDGYDYSWDWTNPIVDDGNDTSAAIALWPASGLVDSDPTKIAEGCTASCTAGGSEPYAAICGDNILETTEGEECEGGAGCSNSCLRDGSYGTCGDGRIDRVSGTGGGEDCDDGNTADGDGCSSACLAEGAGSVLPTAEGPVTLTCGNNDWGYDTTTLAGEECDDGNRDGNDGCSRECLNEGSVTLAQVGGAICGNDVVDAPYENCDEGDITDGDGCSSSCQLEGSSSRYGSQCNDGSVDTGEECEDGNAQNGDGCSSSCLLEGSSTAYASPSYCGDGLTGTGELAACETGTGDGQIDPVQVATIQDQAVYEVTQDSGAVNATIEINESSSDINATATYTLACAATTDQDCSDPLTEGVGIGNCCVERPTVTLYPNGGGVCRNAAMYGVFTTEMDMASFVTSSSDTGYAMYAKLDISTQSCPASHSQIALAGQSLPLKIWNGIVVFFTGQRAEAASGDCVVPVTGFTQAAQSDGTFKVSMTYGAMLEPNATYYLEVLGDSDHTDGLTPGVRSRLGSGLYATQSQTFTTGNDICALDVVSVQDGDTDSPYLFTIDQESHDFTASALSYHGSTPEEISPVTGSYAWTWSSWVSGDTAVVTATQDSTTSSAAAVVAQGENGDTTISATATITDDVNNLSDAGSVTGSAEVTAFLCENPWPAIAQFPWSDDAVGEANGLAQEGVGFMNFSTYYCRDAGDDGETGDLSEVTVVRPLISNAASVIKEYLFEVYGSSDAIGVRIVSNPTYLSPLAWYEAQGFTGTPTGATIDGFAAVEDGRTTYVSAPNIAEGVIYSNMYIFSYNENASDETEDIYSQMLSNLSIVTNVVDTRSCLTRSTEVTTSENVATSCESDFDCDTTVGEYCGSDKLRVQRDMRRLTDLTDIVSGVEAYSSENSAVPGLASGTFVRSLASSVWDSWTDIFGGALTSSVPQDPLNAYRSCGDVGYEDYNRATCVNETTGSYVCPVGSSVYHYRAFGSESYELSADLEYADGAWYSSIDNSDLGTITASATTSTFCDGTVYGSSTRCGDGIIGGTEYCEIGESGGTSQACDSDADGLDDGFRSQVCDSTCSAFVTDSAAVCAPAECGNGIIDGVEQCDDGSANGRYGYCGTLCTYDSGWYCGDGSVAGGEACDCGSSALGAPAGLPYGEDSTCTVYNGTYLTSAGSSCAWDCTGPASYCGDAVVDTGEQCDNNTETYDGQLCNSSSGSQAGEPCTQDSFCRAGYGSTSAASCGGATGSAYDACGLSADGYATTRIMTCADDVWFGDACTWDEASWLPIACQVVGSCGDGTLDTGEACDDGNTDDTDGCTATCTVNVCGDGYLYAGQEQCDEGSSNGAGCDSSYGSSCSACSLSCRYEASSGSFCGDGVINGSEYCDGNDVPFTYFDDTAGTAGSCTALDDVYENTDSGVSYTCRNVGVCNGGERNGEYCTTNSTISSGDEDEALCRGGGVCVFATCASDCATSCPTTFTTDDLLLTSNEPGARAATTVGLYTYNTSSTSLVPNAATITLPACTVATDITADISLDNVTTPEVYIVFVTDVSGSMSGTIGYEEDGTAISRLTVAQSAIKDALAALFDEFGEQVNVALVHYSSSSDISTEDGSGAADIADFQGEVSESNLRSIVDAYTSGGTTKTWEGLDDAQDLLDSVPETNNLRRIAILLSDGEPDDLASDGNAPYTDASVNDFVFSYELYSIALTTDTDLVTYMNRWSSNTTVTDNGGVTVIDDNNDVNPNNGIDYSYDGSTANAIEGAYDSVIGSITASTVTVLGSDDGSTTSVSGTIVDGSSQAIPLPDNFSCNPNAAQDIPVHFTFSGEGQLEVGNVRLKYCSP